MRESRVDSSFWANHETGGDSFVDTIFEGSGIQQMGDYGGLERVFEVDNHVVGPEFDRESRVDELTLKR